CNRLQSAALRGGPDAKVDGRDRKYPQAVRPLSARPLHRRHHRFDEGSGAGAAAPDRRGADPDPRAAGADPAHHRRPLRHPARPARPRHRPYGRSVMTAAALAQDDRHDYVLRLFITGHTEKSRRAVRNITRLCEEHLHGAYELEVIDVYQQPELAVE